MKDSDFAQAHNDYLDPDRHDRPATRSGKLNAVLLEIRQMRQLVRQVERLKSDKAALLEMLETWVKVIRRGDMGDYSPVMDEIFDSEHLIKQMRTGGDKP